MPEKRKPTRPGAPKVDPRALIARLSQEGQQLQEREIIAPLLPGGRIRTRLNGLIYEFKPRKRFVGWGRFRPINEGEADVLGEAMPWERGSYLELFPALRVILLWPAPAGYPPGAWLALPYNQSDAHQRFGFPMEPLPVFLCDPTAGAERFERIIVRVDGRALWFEGPDLLADPTHAEWLRNASTQEASQDFLPGLASSERQTLLFWRFHQLELAHAEETRHVQRLQQRARLNQLSLEEKLRYELAKADATFHSYSEVIASDGSVSQLIVEWSERGQTHRYRSALDPRLTVVSSGICLSGRDQDFDLTSLVSVMTASPDWAGDNEE
jgi:hypothetical protein